MQLMTKPTETIPAFNMYFPSISDMTDKQADFYKFWKQSFLKGEPCEIDGNVSYVFCYCYEVHASNDMKFVYDQMMALADAYDAFTSLSNYCRLWANDALIGMRKFERAAAEFPRLNINQTSSSLTDRLLTLKEHTAKPIVGRDVLTLRGPKVTKFAREHLEEVAQFIDAQLIADQNSNGSLLDRWSRAYTIYSTDYNLFTGSTASRLMTDFETKSFSLNQEILKQCTAWIREAENSFREEKGLPRIGEGWVAETELFYRLKESFSGMSVIHHARPDWLGLQHLDVLIEEASIAIEYQGAQHDRPIDYFGGEEAYKNTLKRDERKRRACKKNGVTLIYVREGYKLNEVINEIQEHIKEKFV